MLVRLKIAAVLSILLAVSASAQAASIIVGFHKLNPEMAGQVVPIFVNSQFGGETITGLRLRAQVGDGGPDLGGTDVAFKMSGDITGPGTLFEHNHGEVFDQSFPPYIVDIITDVANEPITLPLGVSLLGTLTFDTTGVIGIFPLLLSGTLAGDTALPPFFVGGDFDLQIENGVVEDFPEPSGIVLLGMAMIGFACATRRRLRRFLPGET